MGATSRRFLIDATMARCGGGHTFAVNVVPNLARLAPEDRFRLMVRSSRIADSIPALPNVSVDLFPEAGLRERFRFTFLEAPQLAADWGADLYYSIAEYAPLRAPCPVIASCQNLNVFDIRKDWGPYQQFRLRLLRMLAQLSAWRCDRIHFPSETAAKAMGDRLGLPAFRRAPILHGIDLARWRPRKGSCPHGRPYILSVSSIYRYKNFVRLIEAYAELARRRAGIPDLVIIGDDQDPEHSSAMEQARRATGPLASRIHILGEVAYADMPRYYAGASLFVFPSYFESFGFPLLEAMASEVPLVASDIPVFREVAGDAAFYADPFLSDSMATAMEQALYREGAAEALVKRGRERVRSFTWDRSAARLLALFRAVIAERAAREPEGAGVPGWIAEREPAPLALPTTARRDALAP